MDERRLAAAKNFALAREESRATLVRIRILPQPTLWRFVHPVTQQDFDDTIPNLTQWTSFFFTILCIARKRVTQPSNTWNRNDSTGKSQKIELEEKQQQPILSLLLTTNFPWQPILCQQKELILKTIGNRKGDCAWSCSRWQTQPEKICKS